MRVLRLFEDDLELFSSQVNRTSYMVYRDRTENFTIMWQQQGPAYWLKFCITLRSVLQKEGYSINLAAVDANHFEEFFIFLTKLLTGKRVEPVHTYVKDVVSVSRFHQLLSNIPNVFASKESQTSLSFRRLFGLPLEGKNIIKMLGTLPLHLHAVGSLLQLLQRWPEANNPNDINKPWWRPPLSWHYGYQLKATHYEVFLKKHWGEAFLTIIGVKASDVCWWNALPQGERVSAIEERYSELGCFISKTCKELNLPIVDRIAVLEDQMLLYQFFNTAPRGKFSFFWSHPSAVLFVMDTFRELYMTDCLVAFHPFSQIIISFTNAAFTCVFFSCGTGLETQLHDLQQKEALYPFCSDTADRREKVNFLLKILGSHMIKADLALKMNSNFYYSLYRADYWTDTINFERFIWNLPLYLNWLEILLTRVYEFERHFIPVCYFPLRSNVISTVESTYKKLSEVKYIAKSSIIIVEYMIRREHAEAGRCYEGRRLMYKVIPWLCTYMDLFREDIYRILDAILKFGWNEGEREDGECCPLVKDRVKIDLKEWNTVPDIDAYYCDNFRHINYWVSREEFPDMEGSLLFYSEAVEMLREYKISSRKHYNDKREPYNFDLFNENVQEMNFTELFSTPSEEKIGYLTMIMNLLVEDGWIMTDTRENFWFHFNVHYDLDLVKSQIDAKMKETSSEGLTYLNKLINYGTVYYIMACILGDTWKSQLAGQNALAALHRNEALAIMADTGGRLSSLLQNLDTNIIPCPTARYLKSAAQGVKSFTLHEETSLSEVQSMFYAFEKALTVKIKNSTASALKPLKIPKMDEMQIPSVGLNWLEYVDDKRKQLMRVVSNSQFEMLQNASKKTNITGLSLFPQYDILESRLTEEMAAMQKCLELGGIYYGPAYGLCRLIVHRFEWLQQCFIKWKNRTPQFDPPLVSMSNSTMQETLLTIKIRMMAAFIPLEALFLTYISQFKTTHPITEMTIDMLFEWVDSARQWLTEDRWNVTGECLVEYVKGLEKMGCEYIEQLLHHCKKVWVVSPFIMNPDFDVEFGSIEHAQVISTTFTQLFLMSWYAILIKNPRNTSSLQLADKLRAALVHARMILRQVELDEPSILSHSWPKARQVLKKELRSIWSDLLEMRKALCGAVPSKPFPKWYGNCMSIWKEYFSIFVSCHYRNILQKIGFSDFINMPNPDSESTTTTKKESKQDKNKDDTNSASIQETEDEQKQDISNYAQGGKRDKTNKLKGKNKEELDKTNSKEKYVKDDKIQVNKVPRKNSVKFADENPESGVISKLKTCMYCKNMEPVKRTYKKCALCKKEGWMEPRFYCSQTCQVKDWKERHNTEHRNGEVIE